MDYDEMDIVILDIFYLYEYQTHLTMMLMVLKEIMIVNKNLHIKIQIFSFH